jgi:hypothetical protein
VGFSMMNDYWWKDKFYLHNKIMSLHQEYY